MTKKRLYLIGLITLIGFPIPAFLILYFFNDFSIPTFLQLDKFNLYPILLGICIGTLYGFLSNQLMKLEIFKTIPLRVDKLVSSLNLTFWDALFLSLCAGIGEELLFRVGVQFYLGVILTSILFVALHGYLNPKSWRQSLYGFVVLPLSFILGYGYEWLGLWFVVAIHASYDFVLFRLLDDEDDDENLKYLEEEATFD